jgi:hypothetical protein
MIKRIPQRARQTMNIGNIAANATDRATAAKT